MEIIPPFWFKQRQCKFESAGTDNMVKVTGPNLGEAFLRIEKTDNDRWQAALRLTADGPDVTATEPEIPTRREAWDTAFELYRLHIIA